PDITYPFNLFFGLMSFQQLNLKEKISLIKFFIKINFTDSEKLYGLTVLDWLKKEKQSEKSIRIFWEIISIGALNTSTDKASAKIFCYILKEIFWKDKNSCRIILPSLPLSKTFCEPATNFIKRNGGEVIYSERCTSLEFDDEKVIKVKTEKNVYEDFDFVVSAVPFYALEKIIDTSFLDMQPEFHYSSILNVHLWVKDNFIQ
ncbi:MAG: FAD-dependent oxidoreductase, partial [Ignavibacterium sp.]